MDTFDTTTNSTGWLLFVKLSFLVSITAMIAAILFMPGDLMLKGYFGLNSLFMVSSTIMISKTMRDEHESSKMMNKISEAKTNKIIKEYAE
jgi:hypothetical protein